MNKFKLVILCFCCLSFGFILEEFNPFEVPHYFPSPLYAFEKNPIDSNKIQLGRALFYDPILSKDHTISCASCHSPYHAFAHTDHDLSHGINDQIGTRNAPALFNLAWQKSFMWDGAIHHLDMQALAPISHPREMDENIDQVVKKLQASDLYPKLFYQSFQDSIISGAHLLKALAQFQLSLISSTSKYDEVKSGKATFTEQEKKGYQIFKNHCNSCHQEPLFSTYEFANNGLPIDSSLMDYGKGMISKESSDSLLFKIPTLRNLSFTFPYMHDGRFKKLNQVINHYTQEKKITPNLALSLEKPLAISSNEKVDLIAFLLTLDDKKFVFDPKNKFPRKTLLQGEGF